MKTELPMVFFFKWKWEAEWRIYAPVSLVNIGLDNGLAPDRHELLYNPMVTFLGMV